MRHFLTFFFSVILSIASCLANPLSVNQAKKTVVLDGGKGIAGQMTKENTVYVIRDAFDLKGATLTIPQRSVLLFDGGSIENGTVVFADTELAGYPQIRCTLQGSVPVADITWFGADRGNQSTDVGAVINKVQSITTHIIIPSGTFYLTNEAVRIEGEKYLEWDGAIVCTAKKKQFEAVTVASGVVTIDMKGSLVCQSKSINYQMGSQTDITGLVVENINNSTVNIGTISGFNTGLKIFGYGGGCSYNMFSIRAIRECNTGILLTQRDKNGKIGWVNENTFLGGRFGVSSSWDTKKRETHAVVAKGIYSDDSYNKVNSLYFLRPCAEGDYVPFVFHNASLISVIDCRTERGTRGAVISGKSNRIKMTNSFGSSLQNIDVSQLDAYQPTRVFGEIENNSAYQTVDVSVSGTEVELKKSAGAANRIINVDLPSNSSGQRRYIYLVVKETFDGKPAKEEDVDFAQSMYYRAKDKCWATGADVSGSQIILGENVKKISITFKNVQGATVTAPKTAQIMK